MTTNIATDQKGAKSAPQQGVVQSMHPFDRLFDDFFSNRWMRPMRREWADLPETGMFGNGMPKVDIVDRDNEVFVRADLPGIKKDNLDVTLTDSNLTICGHCDEEKDEESGDYYCHEIRHSDFSRTLNLPAEVNSDKVEAVFNHGVLELTMPKVKQSKRRKVKVQ